MDWYKKILGKDWEISPAGGLTGDAYIAKKENKRLFLKRNSSPFLAVLSAEGIVPKLVWTKRMENGDVITAQEWLDGRTLKPEEMQHYHVAKLLHKIHHSSELLHMLMRLGKKPKTSEESFFEIKQRINNSSLLNHQEVKQALLLLNKLLPKISDGVEGHAVCHGDLNHHNILLSNDGQIFLIDWDNAMIADPIIDYGMVLNWYIPKQDWNSWLTKYGIQKDKYFTERIYWYLLIDSLYYLTWHNERKELNKVNERFTDLKKLFNDASALF